MFADIGFVCEICGVVNRYINEERLYKLMDSSGKELPVERIKCRSKKCKAMYDITCYDNYVDLQYVPSAEKRVNCGHNGILGEDPRSPWSVNQFLAEKLAVRGDRKFLKKQGILRMLEAWDYSKEMQEYVLCDDLFAGGINSLIYMTEYNEFMKNFIECLHLMGEHPK